MRLTKFDFSCDDALEGYLCKFGLNETESTFPNCCVRHNCVEFIPELTSERLHDVDQTTTTDLEVTDLPVESVSSNSLIPKIDVTPSMPKISFRDIVRELKKDDFPISQKASSNGSDKFEQKPIIYISTLLYTLFCTCRYYI